MTVADLLARELRRDGARPLVTWYDQATGDRVELSVATSANWAAKIAGHLSEEYDAGPGSALRVSAPLHWISCVALLGVWSTGAAVDDGGDVEVEFGIDAMGMSLSRTVGSQPDFFVPIAPVDRAATALRRGGRSWTHDELAHAATHSAHTHDLGGSARVLSTLPLDTVDGLDAGLLVPLAAGASVVLVANVDAGSLPATAATERVTHTAGVDVAGLSRLDR